MIHFNFKLEPCPLCGGETELINDCITCKCGYILDTIAVLEDTETEKQLMVERNKTSGLAGARHKRMAVRKQLGLD